MQEGSANDAIIDQIETSDLRSGVYEGGFKTWECSLDLASLLLDRGPRKDIDELVRCDQIIEVRREVETFSMRDEDDLLTDTSLVLELLCRL